jgi:cellobiose phosphorylase
VFGEREADGTVRDGNGAFDLYTRHAPSYIEDKSEIHRTEPYCYSQTIAGRSAQNFGEAKNAWLTGTAAWSFVAASQGILGICPDYDGLVIDPCLPDKMDGYQVSRLFRGTRYDITVRRGDHKGMTVDGHPTPGKMVPLTEAEACKVEVII